MEQLVQLRTKRPPKELGFFGLSVSKSKSFKDCKAKYRYSYIKRLPRKEWEHLAYGSFFHKIMEDFHLAIINGNTDPENILMGACFKGAFQIYGSKLTRELRKECYDICLQYLKIRDSRRVLGTQSQVLGIEKEFFVDIDGKILLNGFIDQIQQGTDNILHVADYKTSLCFDKDKDGNVVYIDDYKKSRKYKRYKADTFQLKTYAYVMFLENPELEIIRTSYIFPRHNFDEMVFEYTKKDVAFIEDHFRKAHEEITGEKLFRPNPTILCKWCDYLDVCDAGKQKLNIVEPGSHGEVDWV